MPKSLGPSHWSVVFGADDSLDCESSGAGAESFDRAHSRATRNGRLHVRPDNATAHNCPCTPIAAVNIGASHLPDGSLL